MKDQFYIYRPLLDLIGKTEGTDKGDGYNETLGYGIMLDGKVTKGKGTDVVLVAMSLDQVDALQTRMLADPDNRQIRSSAIGRYQIVRTTMREICNRLRLTGRELFNAAMQDRLACYLLGKRGIDKWLAGQMSDSAMLNELAKEWASLPNAEGVGHYKGQRAAVGHMHVLQVLNTVRSRRQAGSASTPPVAAKKGGVIAAIIAIFKAIFGLRS